MPIRWSRKASTVSSGSHFPVSLKAFSPASTSFQEMALAVLGGRGVEDELRGRPDVDADPVAFDVGDDRLVRHLERAVGAIVIFSAMRASLVKGPTWNSWPARRHARRPRPRAAPGGALAAAMAPARRSAASTALRNSIARVIGPTPPIRGVIQPATSATDSSTSDSSRLPSRETPAPTTAAPGLTMSRCHQVGPARGSYDDVALARRSRRGSATPVCTTVTAAFKPGRFRAINRASGRPIVSPRPTITTCRPLTGTS